VFVLQVHRNKQASEQASNNINNFVSENIFKNFSHVIFQPVTAVAAAAAGQSKYPISLTHTLSLSHSEYEFAADCGRLVSFCGERKIIGRSRHVVTVGCGRLSEP